MVPVGILCFVAALVAAVHMFTNRQLGPGAPLFMLGSIAAGLVLLLRSSRTSWRPVRQIVADRVSRGLPPVPLHLRLRLQIRRIGIFTAGVVTVVLLYWKRWGPMSAAKIAFASALIVGLALTFDIFRAPRHDPASRRVSGMGAHASRMRYEWPLWRRLATTLSGIGLCLTALAQWVGATGSRSKDPIAAASCLIVVGGLGGSLLLIGTAKWGWRKQGPAAEKESWLKRVFK